MSARDRVTVLIYDVSGGRRVIARDEDMLPLYLGGATETFYRITEAGDRRTTEDDDPRRIE